MQKAERRDKRNATGVNARIGARVQAALKYFKERYLPISKWTSVTAMALALVVVVMAMSYWWSSSPSVIETLMKRAMTYSIIPVLLAAAAWSLANQARDRKLKLFGILALWVCLAGLVVAQVQYFRLVQGAQIENTPAQQQQQQQN